MDFATQRRLVIQAAFADDLLMEHLVLKGGNALALVHEIGSRSSVDVDFSLGGDLDIAELGERLRRSLEDRFDGAGYEVFDFNIEPRPADRTGRPPTWGGYTVSFKLLEKARRDFLPRIEDRRRQALVVAAAQQRKFRIEISRHEYTAAKEETELDGFTIYVYPPAMIAIEKLRAICSVPRLSSHSGGCEIPGSRIRLRRGPRLGGRAVLVRYADDLVIVFANEHDARRVAEVLPKRLGRFGLRLHPEKTRLVPFQRPRWGSESGGPAGPGTFTFLGFTHFWGKGRRTGSWVVKRRTATSRFTRSMQRVREWCRRCRHAPLALQQRQLSQRLRGHYGYYGIVGNYRALDTFYRQVTREWRKWLDRRSGKKSMPWERFNRLLGVYPLPRPRIVHTTV